MPLVEDYLEKKTRYWDYLMHSKIVVPILKKCIEGAITGGQHHLGGDRVSLPCPRESPRLRLDPRRSHPGGVRDAG